MHDQNGNPVHRDIRRNSYDGLWYKTVWFGSHYATNVRRYGYRTRAEARDGDISDANAASYREPTCPECEHPLDSQSESNRCHNCYPAGD